MNLILFHQTEIGHILAKSDPRASHILEVLQITPGGRAFDIGIINGPRGQARLCEICQAGLVLDFQINEPPKQLYPITLLIAYARPIIARRILFEATTLGVNRFLWFVSDKGEPSYAQARLWRGSQYEAELTRGAQQAFSTVLPQVHQYLSLDDGLADLPSTSGRLALDVYEATQRLGECKLSTPPVILAIGGERGWSPRERSLLRKQGFVFAHLGERVLRCETAALTAIGIMLSKLSLI